MRSDTLAPSTSLHATLPDSWTACTGPVAVAVGGAVDRTLRAGEMVAEQLGRGMAVISVIEPPAIYPWSTLSVPLPPEFEQDRLRARRSFLEGQMRTSTGRQPHATIEVLIGGVPRGVARVAENLDAPLIVMGLGSSQPIDRLLRSETVLRTVGHARCPVLAVTPEFVSPLKTVVVGVDFSDDSADAVRRALPLLARHATLYLVHVWQPAGTTAPLGPQFDDHYRSELPNRFARLVAALDLPPELSVETEALEGRPAEQLHAQAERRHADLIVVGRHGGNPLERLLVGSVATRVLRSATCSVLVVPEPSLMARERLAERRGVTMRVVARNDWRSYLDGLTRRLAGHIVALEVRDPERRCHTQEGGYPLFGISFDPLEGRLEIILGEPHGRSRHLTRVIPDASGLAALLDPGGAERGVYIAHGTGHTLLTVVPPTHYSTS